MATVVSDSNQILEDLSEDLNAFSSIISVAKPFVIPGRDLVDRKDTPRERIGIGEIRPEEELLTGPFVVRDIVQRYRVQIFLRYGKGNSDEERLEARINDLKDEVIRWIVSRSGNIYNVNNDLKSFTYDLSQDSDIDRQEGYYEKFVGIRAKRTLIQ